MDVVKYENGFWLVPYWLDNSEQKVSRPERIISLATLPHQFGKGSPEITVNDPVPKYVFDGRIPPQEASKYVVVEHPNILVPLGPREA
jgi:hypothetical protein